MIKQTHRLTKTEEKVIALQNGCICCTLRGDLLEELVRLAELQTFDYIIIESSGISEPEQVAETFDNRLAEQMEMMGDTPEGLDADMIKVLQQLYVSNPESPSTAPNPPSSQQTSRRSGKVRPSRHDRHRNRRLYHLPRL